MELSREGIKFITDETLDVGLCSPLDGPEEGDPGEPSERRVVQTIDINVFLGESESSGREEASQWSPLSPEKLKEVMKEANMLAAQLEKCQLREKENDSCSETGLETVPECEPLPPIRLLPEEKLSFRKTRRRTFDVKNSLLKALLPTVSPEPCLAHSSPRAPSPKWGGRASCSMDLPSSKELHNKSKTCSAGDQLSKKSGPKQSLKPSTVMKTGTKKPQAISRSSRKGRPPPLSSCDAAHQQSPVHLKPLPRTNRKTEGTAGKDGPIKESQLSHKDSSRESTTSIARVKRKPDPKLFPSETKPLKESLAAPEKTTPLRKANASQSKTMGDDGPQLQIVSKPRRGSCQIRSSRPAMSPLASRLPVPKAASCMASFGRRTEAVSGRPSQLQLLNLGVPGGKGSTVPTPARKKASAFQQTAPSGLSQNSRLRLPKKATSDNSRQQSVTKILGNRP